LRKGFRFQIPRPTIFEGKPGLQMENRVSKGEKILKRISNGRKRSVFPVAPKFFPVKAHETVFPIFLGLFCSFKLFVGSGASRF
jgi:hypothetical protein